jgi:hypothetical protein
MQVKPAGPASRAGAGLAAVRRAMSMDLNPTGKVLPTGRPRTGAIASTTTTIDPGAGWSEAHP